MIITACARFAVFVPSGPFYEAKAPTPSMFYITLVTSPVAIYFPMVIRQL